MCQKLGIDAKDRLQNDSKKMKFLVKGPLPSDEIFPKGSQDFTVVHDYLQTSSPKMQVRLRKRGQKVGQICIWYQVCSTIFSNFWHISQNRISKLCSCIPSLFCVYSWATAQWLSNFGEIIDSFFSSGSLELRLYRATSWDPRASCGS